MTDLVEAALEFAKTQIGVREVTRNRSPQIDKYHKAGGLDPAGAHAYCVSFLRWCFLHASVEVGQNNPMPRTARAVGLWTLAPLWTRTEKPVPGAIFCRAVAPGDPNSKGHAGFVVDVTADDMLVTIEGNTNPEGSREGDGVYQRQRPIGYPNLGYVDFSRMPGAQPLVASDEEITKPGKPTIHG
jgi:hypothetical protein